MKIAAINGSPKAKDSVSERIIGQIAKISGKQIQTFSSLKMKRSHAPEEALAAILQSDILLIVFPLYVDSLPAHLIELLARLETASSAGAAKPKVFAVVNCGFFETIHTELSLEMIEHFAKRAEFPWGFGIGVGGGGMLSSLGENWKNGPAGRIHEALRIMVHTMQSGGGEQNIFTTPVFPHFLYRIAAQMGMKSLAKRNGVRNLRARPYIEVSE